MNINRSKLWVVYRLARRHWFKGICGVFIFYMLFLGDYSVMNILSLERQEIQLRKEISQFTDSIDHFDNRLKEVEANSEQLERYAREKLHMHRENEDLYLIDK